MSFLDELERLNTLKEKGVVSENEFLELKKDILEQKRAEDKKRTLKQSISDEKTWSVLIHLSQLCSFMIPFSGSILAIVLWQIKKDESEFIDLNGKIVANWIISKCIYFCAFSFMCFFIIGLPLLFILIILAFIFPIIGAVTAGSGNIWRYPFAINFFKVSPDDKNYIVTLNPEKRK